MIYRVVMTRRRVIEEKISTTVSTPDATEAIAASEHLLEGHIISWKYHKTLETSIPIVVVTETNLEKPNE